MNPSAPSPLPSPTGTGPRYWRSLDELGDTPAFREWVQREFPQGASELDDGFSRRNFVRIMSASFLLAGFGLTGCRRPEERIHPFSKMPENYAHGVPQYFATSMPDRLNAQPLLVKAMDGRPLKIEGNPRHPLGLPGTDRYAQASILDLYDPDRATQITRQHEPVSREKTLDYLTSLAGELAKTGGKGAAFLLAQSSSPSRLRLIKEIREKLPQARWFTHEPVDFSIHREAASQAHATSAASQRLQPFYRLDKAKVVVSLDSDFIGSEADCARLIHGFSSHRKIETPAGELNRLYVVEALMTLTGGAADHRLRLSSGEVGIVAAHLAAAVLQQAGGSEAAALIPSLTKVALPAEVKPAWIEACAKDLLERRGASVVLAGYRQPLYVHLLAQAMNRALGNEGTTVELHACAEAATGTLGELAQALGSGEISTLVITGGNPAYTAPANLNWAAAQRKAAVSVRLSYHDDETAALSQWNLPVAHYLESWGDGLSADGTLTPVQPLIAPIFGGFTELELLARLGGLTVTNPHDIVRETFKSFAPTGDFEVAWKTFLRNGHLAGSAARHVDAPLNWARISEVVGAGVASLASQRPPAPDRLEVIFHRDHSLDDGRYSNNGWLQELPDPMTKVSWDNVISVSAKTAKALGVFFVNPERSKLMVPMVSVELNGQKIEGPVWVQPGQADNTLGLPLGYGRTKTGRVGKDAGYNAYLLCSGTGAGFTAGARVTALDRKHQLATTQDHWAMEGRPVVREANLNQFREHPDFAHQMDLDSHMPKDAALYKHPHNKNPLMKGAQQWGMAVDLNACVGCSACVMACQSENNIPIVGKDQVARGREMHWIRVDRYYSIREDDIDLSSPQMVSQPLMCQHCENAPCENVCPVNATVHDEEGLNVMVFNRCVGTRYCSNNCPYKVRRFNFFDFNQRPLDKLYLGPLAPKGMPDLLQMSKNPEVTVRMRGVMEKCSFCIQRIESAKIAQKVKAGPSGDVKVPDGAITPACAQACPAQAIVFGDVADKSSRVSKLKEQERNYSVLGWLHTEPRTTYLARIRNPNPRMPDYYEQPLSLVEYARLNGDPMHASHHESSPAAHGAAEKGGH